ncbi:MAG: ribose-phosphate pyrophosphokinase [Nitrospinota bacterium]|nr:ribose-phosphate pyrophosphokinase [Nitrospinota bacterium]MDP7169414.1 ribose-phosphate pyrophosphokinase [Nitrospinota bacterium]MDP7369588.1 ribose-phosphate pyrophosphokinase [Nitrospinota bacterium]MDP7502447.1 ribose-phosphate pyrophosphokinase [Nitrospinota bacterium]MDP7662000.1 ribose-phosphate pyrophosphokinase [Nitrospinota bacterium]
MKGYQLKVFAGRSNPVLGKQIVGDLGIDPGAIDIIDFSDEETFVQVMENIRGADVFAVQSLCQPGNANLMELLIMMDAFRRSSAERITAVIPYFAYARQDRKVQPRVPITAKLIANLLVAAGADRVITMDLHAGQIQGFFDIPVDHLFAGPIVMDYFKKRDGMRDLTVISPDAGGVERARAYAKRLDAGLGIIDKRRERANISEVFHIIGDVRDRDVLIVDDIVDTAGTLTLGAKALVDAGARRVFATCTHPVLSGPAIDRIIDSPIEELVVSDTIPLSEEGARCNQIKVVSVANLLAEAIRRIHEDASVSSLFE